MQTQRTLIDPKVTLVGKTDGSATALSDFGLSFFIAPGKAVKQASDVHTKHVNYFTFSGLLQPGELLFYAVKAGPGYDLHQFAPDAEGAFIEVDQTKYYSFQSQQLVGGKNKNTAAISHVSFYTGLGAVPVTAVPEPTTLPVWGSLLAIGTFWGCRKRTAGSR